MARKQRLALGLGPPGRIVGDSGSVVYAPVSVNAANGTASAQIDMRTVRRAEYSFPVECAYPRERCGLHEIVFVQLDPFDETRLVRVAAVRFVRQRFVESAARNEPFRADLEKALQEGPGGRGPVGYYTSLGQNAKAPPQQTTNWSAMVDAELDLIVVHENRAAIIFFEGAPAEMGAAMVGATSRIGFVAQLQVTLSSGALADLLYAWKNLADGMRVS
jgi:hypothetical protein